MGDHAALARSPLTSRLRTEPPTVGDPGVVVTEGAAGRAFTVLARRESVAALTERCQAFGVALPSSPRRIVGRDYAILWTGPGQWLVQADDREADRLLRLFGSFAALCATITVDDARLVLSIRGPRAADTLSKMLTIDLHPRAFRPGDAAMTVAGGMSVLLWLRDDAPVFECSVPRSMAGSFADWLLDSAAEYGCAIGSPDQPPPG